MLGARIAALRRQAGFSQAELAERLRISASAVGMYEQGRREPSLQALVELATVFGVSTDYLLTGKPVSQQDGIIVPRLLTQATRPKCSRKGSLSREEQAILLAAMSTEG